MDRVLIVEDDANMREMLTHIVRGEGFEVVTAADGKQALCLIGRGQADVVVLDRMLPDMDGINVCKNVRKKSRIPIIILSALTTPTDKVASLNVGADDYLGKPFDPGELAARIRVQLRRLRDDDISSPGMDLLKVGDLHLDPSSLEMSISGEPVHVTRLEFQLLHALARRGGQTVPREQLIRAVWTDSRYIDPAGLNVYVRRLRKRIERIPDRPERLLTVRTIGYKLVAPRNRAA